MPRLQTLGLLVAALVLAPACGKGGKKKKKKRIKEPVAAEAGAEAPAKAPPRRADALIPTPAALAIAVGDRAYLWTDGRTAATSAPAAQTTWSKEGFAYPDAGATRVLAPGGGAYWRFTPSTQPSTPLGDLFATQTTPPIGFELRLVTGPGTRTRVNLVGPEDRSVRVGLFNESPTAYVWLQGAPPAGVRPAPPPDPAVGWTRDPNSQVPLPEPPAGASPLHPAAPDPADLQAWLADIATLRAGPVTALTSARLDLDGDPAPEGFVCVNGGKGDQPCFVIDEVGSERRYHGVDLPYDDPAKGEAPTAYTQDGATYLLWVGRPPKAGEGTPKVAQVLRLGSTGYTVDTIR